MNFRKLVQIVNYILARHEYKLNYTKLIKILYIADRECMKIYDFPNIADRECMKIYDFPITDDEYCALPQGMVLSGLLYFINGENTNHLEQTEWDMRFQKIGYDLISTLKSNDNYNELCDAEIEILDKVDKQYGGKNWRYLVDKVIHKFPEWREVKDEAKNGIPIPISKRKILSALDKSEDNIKEILSSENDRLSLECELRKHK